MAQLQGEVGEVRMTIQIKRKDTGRVETHELVGRVEAVLPPNQVEGEGNDALAQHGGAQRGD